ncbi:triose-phosphate isomerase [Patescibacteria group bacterium]|nr:triose-phosphate isomerase [Patescibacteria group bacterium]MBU1896066.1 triose-phosphate isomerase [Patescibacteria group bacterium]
MTYIFANWKMYLSYQEVRELSIALSQEDFDEKKLKITVFPNTINFSDVARVFAGRSFAVGAQNVGWTPQGAYTGAVSALLFQQAGAKYALVGHSERRYIFNEDNEAVHKKMEACLVEGIIPVLCIGETAEDLKEQKREYRIKKQLSKALEGLNLKGKEIIVAYEPVWAISAGGKGTPCTPADADNVHGWIKNELKQYTKQNVPILYGGSVDSKNVLSYVEQGMIDGVLVGSASTKLDEFVKLVRRVESL